MSRIDISVSEKNTDNFIANRGFCRSTALEYFCEQSDNSQLQDFAYEISMGVELNAKTIKVFIEKIEYVLLKLKVQEDFLTLNRKKLFINFLDDLMESKSYLHDFSLRKDLDNFNIEII